MKEFEGTPGPWYVEDGALGNETLIVLSDNFPFKMMSRENRDLITAAPELLKELQSIIECLDKGVPLDEENCGYEFDNARKVIAKALGE